MLRQLLLSRQPIRCYGARRTRLTSKQGNKDYYKGKRAGAMGTLTAYGNFVPDPLKMRQWVIPDLTGFELRPYVARTCRPVQDAPKNVRTFMEQVARYEGLPGETVEAENK